MTIVWSRQRYRRHSYLNAGSRSFVAVWVGIQAAAAVVVTGAVTALTGLSGLFIHDEEVEEG